MSLKSKEMFSFCCNYACTEVAFNLFLTTFTPRAPPHSPLKFHHFFHSSPNSHLTNNTDHCRVRCYHYIIWSCFFCESLCERLKKGLVKQLFRVYVSGFDLRYFKSKFAQYTIYRLQIIYQLRNNQQQYSAFKLCPICVHW